MPEVPTIDVPELKRLRAGERPPVVLDVLPAAAHEEKRLPGAVNACVYETTFLEQVERVVPDRGTAVVVHGSRPTCAASRDAADRLVRAGYARVLRFAGGREAWEAAGEPFEGTRKDEPWRPAAGPVLADRVYAVDPSESLVDWTGRNVANRHFGTMRLAGGTVEVRDGIPAVGAVEVDMTSIEVGDLEGEMADLLAAHLASEDFFATDRFPTARLEIRGAAPIPDASPGAPNVTVTADLELRGETLPVSLSAVVAPHGEDGLAVQAVLEVDRTRWGATYGSGRMYDRLGMHLVNDLVTLQVRVVARRA